MKKLKELNQKCGQCKCIDYCADPFEDLCLCRDSRFSELTDTEYIKRAEMVAISYDKKSDETINEFIARKVYEQNDYIKKYEELWKDIVEHEDGSLNKDQVMRELSDYSMIMDNCTKAYMAMSDGMISKPNTCFFEVESIFDDRYIKKEYVKEEIEKIIKGSSNFDELRKELKDYINSI